MSWFWNYLIRRVVTPFMEIKDLEKETSCVAVASDTLSVRWPWHVRAKMLWKTVQDTGMEAE